MTNAITGGIKDFGKNVYSKKKKKLKNKGQAFANAISKFSSKKSSSDSNNPNDA